MEPGVEKYDDMSDEQCPVCGYYCLGKGGIGCIDKPGLVEPMTPDSQMTLEDVKKAIATLKKYAVRPKVVKNGRQAWQMTKTDPAGTKWSQGDEYYEMHQLNKITRIKAK